MLTSSTILKYMHNSQMTLTKLMIKCKNCGSKFPSFTQINEVAFETTPIAKTEQCPSCNEMLSYSKNDYFFEWLLVVSWGITSTNKKLWCERYCCSDLQVNWEEFWWELPWLCCFPY